MQISIKTSGEDQKIRCEYTGAETGVLVRLASADEEPGPPSKGIQTGWLSRKALEDALRVISSLDGGGAPAMRTSAATGGPSGPQEAAPAPTAPVQRQAPASPPVSTETIQGFDRELVRLVKTAEQEEPEEGKKKGVKEQDIRDLILKYRMAFGASGTVAAFRVLNARLGMARERFDLLWSMKPERLTIEGAED